MLEHTVKVRFEDVRVSNTDVRVSKTLEFEDDVRVTEVTDHWNSREVRELACSKTLARLRSGLLVLNHLCTLISVTTLEYCQLCKNVQWILCGTRVRCSDILRGHAALAGRGEGQMISLQFHSADTADAIDSVRD
eukprot:SAG31_NODE_1121_length_9797_cov_16.183749_8_plen_135_part_00